MKSKEDKFTQEVSKLLEETIRKINYTINLNLQRFCSKSLNLAIKHSETLKQIKKDIKDLKR